MDADRAPLADVARVNADRPYLALYMDECHRPRWRVAAWHGLALVVSLFVWFGLVFGAISLWRWLTGQ